MVFKYSNAHDIEAQVYRWERERLVARHVLLKQVRVGSGVETLLAQVGRVLEQAGQRLQAQAVSKPAAPRTESDKPALSAQ